MIKLGWVFAIVWLTAACWFPPISYADNGNIEVLIDGKQLVCEVPPQIINERTMVPMRAIFEALGAKVEWNAGYRSVVAVKGTDTVSLAIGNSFAKVNGQIKSLDAPPVIINNRTLVPVRFVAESLGSDVQWDSTARTVVIKNKPKADTGKPTSETPPPTDVSGKYVSGYKLSQDIDFMYRTGKKVTLQAGTTLAFYKNGFISEGCLAADSELDYGAGKSALFKGGTNVVFNSDGYVVKGELAQPVTLEYMAGQSVELKAGKVEFSNGYVSAGILANLSELRYQDGVRIPFQAGKEIAFYPNGNVRRGTPVRDSFLPYNNEMLNAPTNLNNTDGTSALFTAGTEVAFTSKGLVEKGVLKQDTSLAYSYSQYTIFQQDSDVLFKDGYIQKGIIRDHLYMNYRDDKNVSLKSGTMVVFNDQKRVQQGVLLYDTKLEYRSDKEVEFQADSEVEFNKDGYVCRGTMKWGSKLRYNESWDVLMLSGQEVKFNEAGFIQSGYLADYFSSQYAVYNAHTRIEFDDKGEVIYGTLKESAKLPRGNDEWVLCKELTEVYFHPNYYIKEGTLTEQQKLPYSYDKTNAKIIAFQSGSKITFTDKGFVASGILKEDSILDYATDKNTTFKAGTAIEFYPQGYVKSGTIKNAGDFLTERNEIFHAEAGTVVYFNSQGLLERIKS